MKDRLRSGISKVKSVWTNDLFRNVDAFAGNSAMRIAVSKDCYSLW
jgi:hypothetical protein